MCLLFRPTAQLFTQTIFMYWYIHIYFTLMQATVVLVAHELNLN